MLIYYVLDTSLQSPEEDLEAVDYSLFFDKDTVFAKISSQLIQGSLKLLEYSADGVSVPLVEFNFDNLSLGAEYRLKTDTIIMSASLKVRYKIILYKYIQVIYYVMYPFILV